MSDETGGKTKKNSIAPKAPKHHVPIHEMNKPIRTSDIRGSHRGRRGDDVEQRQAFFGPTKRSADPDDFVALEMQVRTAEARAEELSEQLETANAEVARLRAREKALDSIGAIDEEKLDRYRKMRYASKTLPQLGAGSLGHMPPIARIDATIDSRNLAVEIADVVAEIAATLKAGPS